MNLIALDLAGETGVCWGRLGAVPEWTTIALSEERGPQLRGLINELRKIFGELPDQTGEAVTQVVVEQRPPAFGMMGRATANNLDQQCQLEGAVYLACYDLGLPPPRLLSASKARGALIPGGGKIRTKDKEAGVIVRWCQSEGYRVFDDNAADALVLWLYCAREAQLTERKKGARNAKQPQLIV